MDTSRVRWRKSTHSTGNGGECVEIGAWRKSSHSAQEGDCVEAGGLWRASSYSANNGACVEVGAGRALVLARDSKDPEGPVLGFGTDAWAAFLNTVKSGHFDLA